MTVSERKGSPGQAASPHLAERDIRGLLFTADMYAVQLDQLAVLLAATDGQARAVVARWRRQGYAASGRLGTGPPWIWLTRSGLAAAGLRYTAAPPALARLAHLRAVTAVRLALEATSGYRQGGAFWRGERRLRGRAGAGGRVGLREHVPDGEVHWPDGGPDTGPHLPWAGECWAIEAELTRKTVTRTTAIMREMLARTGDYGCPAADVAVPGRPPRHARALYVCSPAARPTVTRARGALGAGAARIEIRDLPVLAWGDDPPIPPAKLAWGDDPPIPPAKLAWGDDPPTPPAKLAWGDDPPITPRRGAAP